MIRISSSLQKAVPKNCTFAFYAFDGDTFPANASNSSGPLAKAFALAKREGFDGKSGTVRSISSPSLDQNLLFVGLGKSKDATLDSLRRATASLVRTAESLHVNKIALRAPVIGPVSDSFQAMTEGALLGSYTFDAYQTGPDKKKKLESLLFIAKTREEKAGIDQGIKIGSIFASSVCFARDLTNRPPSDTTPEYLAKVAKTLANASVRVLVYDKRQMEKMGMGAILGVSRGSHQPPYFLHLIYKPGARARKKIAICGKGITFDSGGLSLKPAGAMETMKCDMAGAASVLAVFKGLPLLKPAVEVHGFAALTENMPGGNAVKPGDVLKSMKGKTIEVLNTDAEGRLILADILHFACQHKPDEMVDLATLTGAVTVALGSVISGLMGTDAKLIQRIKDASKKSGEKVWELPLEKEYEVHLKSKVADLKNIGAPGEAGTIMGGLFLKEFVDATIPWVHLDIAGTDFNKDDKPLAPAGATGVMIRTLLHYVTNHTSTL